MKVFINCNDKDIMFLFEKDIDTNGPVKIHVCKCLQCKHVKNKRKNRKSKIIIKRLMNKRRRKMAGKVINHYWS